MNTEPKTVKITITAADAMTGAKEGKTYTRIFTEQEYFEGKYKELINTTLPEGKAWSYEFNWQ